MLAIVSRFWRCTRTKYRYFAFSLIILTLFTEMSSRVGISLAMIGGMAKDNCTDPLDIGEYCFSTDIKGALLGAFFYGYAFQVAPTTLARFIGFNLVYRSTTLVSGIIQILFPLVIGASPIAAVAMQALKGLSAGIFMSNNMDFTRKWSLRDEGTKFVALCGMTTQIGMGLGPMVAGLITTSVGWRYYFYLSGCLYLLMFCALVVFVPNTPLDARLMGEDERNLFQEKQRSIELVTPKDDSDGQNQTQSTPIKILLTKAYLWAFCLYMVCAVFHFYTIMTNIPFFLNKVLHASAEQLSFLQLALGIVGAIGTTCFTILLPKIDKKMTWKKARIMFFVSPMLTRALILAVLAYVNNLVLAIVLLSIVMITYGTTFSGGIVTTAYEMKPADSAMVMGIFNSFGQVSGFLSPLVMTKLTDVDEHHKTIKLLHIYN